MEEFFYVGFWRGEDRERGFFAGEPFFLGKERFPRTPSKESRFYAVCPAEGGSGRIRKDAAGDEERRTGVFCGGTFLSGERKVPPRPLQRKPLLRGLPRGERVRPRGSRARPTLRGADARSGFLGESARGAFFLLKEGPSRKKNKSAIILQSGFPRARILRPRSDPRPEFHRCS